MPRNPSELARLEEEDKEMNSFSDGTLYPAQFLKWKQAAYPFSKEAMDKKVKSNE